MTFRITRAGAKQRSAARRTIRNKIMKTEYLTQTESAKRSLEQIVAEHPFLRGMSPAHLAILTDAAMLAEFEGGELLFREGDPANRFYLIREGQVVLESPSGEGSAVPIQVIGAGDVLGWSWLFPPYSWRFDARTVGPVKAIFFYGTRLREQCEADHDLGYELMKRMTAVVIQRLQGTREQLLQARTT